MAYQADQPFIYQRVGLTRLTEILDCLLVDDASDREYLRGELEAEVSALPVHVNIIRSSPEPGDQLQIGFKSIMRIDG